MARNPIKASAFTTWLSWLQPFCPIVGGNNGKNNMSHFSLKTPIFSYFVWFYHLEYICNASVQNFPHFRAKNKIWAQKIENDLQRVPCVIVFNIAWERSNAKTGHAADQRERERGPKSALKANGDWKWLISA